MGRGLGRIQRKIIQRLKTRKPDPPCPGYHDVRTLAHEIMHDFEVWDNYTYRALTESESQSFWRALRTLEKRGLIESYSYWPGHTARSIGGSPRGGLSHSKGIRLVHTINAMNSTHNTETIPGERRARVE